jgi:two-component system, OmpR family, response regulator
MGASGCQSLETGFLMRILLAEDNEATAQFIAAGLADLNHSVMLAATGEAALDLCSRYAFDVVVLDRLMPDGDGISVLKTLRGRGSQVPVLMLTALDTIRNRVEGLEAGADDYLVKPFDMEELVARLAALVRRARAGPDTEVDPTLSLDWQELSLDLLRRTATYRGEAFSLFPREFRLLEDIMREGGQVVTRSMLLERVWGFHFDPKTNIVETHVSRLRSRLAEVGAQHLVETVRGVGYRMRAPRGNGGEGGSGEAP